MLMDFHNFFFLFLVDYHLTHSLHTILRDWIVFLDAAISSSLQIKPIYKALYILVLCTTPWIYLKRVGRT
jgi:hypothetical protein